MSERRPRIVALGQPIAGDDGVGPRVLRELEARLSEETAELRVATEASQLLQLLQYAGPVWIVDAVIDGDRQGQLLELSPEALMAISRCSVSSHGISVAQAIELCRMLYPEMTSASITIFAIPIGTPRAYEHGLSAPVEAGMRRCVKQLLERLGPPPHGHPETQESRDQKRDRLA